MNGPLAGLLNQNAAMSNSYSDYLARNMPHEYLRQMQMQNAIQSQQSRQREDELVLLLLPAP